MFILFNHDLINVRFIKFVKKDVVVNKNKELLHYIITVEMSDKIHYLRTETYEIGQSKEFEERWQEIFDLLTGN